MENKDLAFPVVRVNYSMPVEGGLIKREWFAGMAMNGILSQVRIEDRVEKTVSEWAYAIADAMLSEREG